jgi:hypothetical protein
MEPGDVAGAENGELCPPSTGVGGQNPSKLPKTRILRGASVKGTTRVHGAPQAA